MDVYREQILEHYRHPRNKGVLPNPDATATVQNSTCGDALTLGLSFDTNGVVSDARFDGTGCAVSQAAASLVSEELKGKTREQLAALGRDDVFRVLGGPVSPGREQCALLVLRALANTLTDGNRPA